MNLKNISEQVEFEQEFTEKQAAEETATPNFPHELDQHGDLITIQEFLAGVKSTAFTDYDGFGHPSNGVTMNENTVVRPSELTFPPDTTHIVWYNK